MQAGVGAIEGPDEAAAENPQVRVDVGGEFSYNRKPRKGE